MDFLDVLSECADVLSAPGWDQDRLGDYQLLLADLQRKGNLPDDADRLADALQKELEMLRAGDLAFAPKSPQRAALIKQVDAYRDSLGAPRYLYHGTVFSRLKTIHRDGLRPGEVLIWRSDTRLAQRCSEAVFFADRWRGAAFFADIAHHRSRGPRDGPGRRPVIIRVSASKLAAEPNQLATVGGSWMVRGVVPIEGADVFIAPHQGLPCWQPLAEVLNRGIVSRCGIP